MKGFIIILLIIGGLVWMGISTAKEEDRRCMAKYGQDSRADETTSRDGLMCILKDGSLVPYIVDRRL